MKKIYKKLICFVFALVALTGVMSINAFANSGKEIGNGNFSDIVVYINHYAIPSVNYNGDMYVRLDDIKNYGFSTSYDDATKTTSIHRNYENYIASVETFKCANINVGKFKETFYESNIKVRIGNKDVPTYTDEFDKILFRVKDLANLDNVTANWVPELRCVKIWVNDGLTMRSTPQYPPEYKGLAGRWVPYIMFYNNGTVESAYGAKGYDLYLNSDHTAKSEDNSRIKTWEYIASDKENSNIYIYCYSNNNETYPLAYNTEKGLLFVERTDGLFGYTRY